MRHTHKLFLFSLTAGLFFTCNTAVSLSAGDKWGGDDRMTDSNTKYQTGIATSISNCEQTSTPNWCWTLNDGSKNWQTNELRGKILQADASREVYWLIKSNTNNSITVYGSSIVDSDEEAKRSLEDENTGSERYAVLDRFKVAKVNNRWMYFDPYGNSYWAKAINGYVTSDSRRGRNYAGQTWDELLQAHPIYGGTGSGTDANTASLWKLYDLIKAKGFNATGEANDYYRMVPGSYVVSGPIAAQKIPSRYMPFTLFPRINSLALASTPTFTVNGISIRDAYGANFQPEIVDAIHGCDGEYSSAYSAFTLFGEPNPDVPACDSDRIEIASWGDYLLTPYEKFKYNIAANPYIIGIKWDEEPAYVQQTSGSEHMGYRIFISTSGTPRKDAAVAYLQTQYATITALNNAWGTSYADWTAVSNDTGTQINAILTYENQSGKAALWDWSPFNEVALHPNIMRDLNAIAENFWRTYTKKVHDAIDSILAVDGILNMGPGYHGSKEWLPTGEGSTSPEYLFRGSVSADRSETYIDVISIGNVAGAFKNSPSDKYFNYQGPKMSEYYSFHGRPLWITSTWVNAESDSGVFPTGILDSSDTIAGTYFIDDENIFYMKMYSGTVTSNSSNQLIDSGKIFSSDSSSNIKIQVGDIVKDTTDNQSATTLPCPGDPKPSPTTDPDPILNSGGSHILCLSDDIFTGSENYIIYGGQSLFARSYTRVACGLNTKPINEIVFFRVTDTAASTDLHTVSFHATVPMIGPGKINSQWLPYQPIPATFSNYCHVGDSIDFIMQDNFANFDGYKNLVPAPSIYIIKTQEERGQHYASYIDEMINLRAANGDYFLTGFSHWSWWDFNSGNRLEEKRNHGWMSVNSNLYDGSATIANGEIQDTGDFVTAASTKILSIYDDIFALSGLSTIDTTPPQAPSGVTVS